MTVPAKRGPPPATTRVHVNNLPWQLDPTVVKKELELVCAKFGLVEDVYIAPYIEGPRESKVRNALKAHAGWARVTFATLEDSGRAVICLPGSDLLGSRIRAHYAKPEPVAEAPPDPAAVAARLELIAARKSQYQRRRARQFERLQAILDRLPAPGGLDAMERLPSLAALLPPSGQPIVDWKAMPAACDPCRGGSLGAADTDPCEDAEGDTVGGGGGDACDEEDVCDRGADSAASTVRSEHDPDRHLPLRGRKKRWQVESFVLVLRALLTEGKPYRLVDFGSGTGNLLLPLAALFSWCSFHAVEMKPNAVSLLLSRAAAAGLTNVTAEVGMIEHSSCAFDVALALHACGNATDYAMALAVTQRAAYVAIPCCIGKLKFSVDHGGSSFHRVHKRWTPRFVDDPAYDRALQRLAPEAGSISVPTPIAALKPQRMSDEDRAALGSRKATAENDTRSVDVSNEGEGEDYKASIPLLTHPRSDWLRSNLADPVEDFKAIARVGDISHGASQDGGQGITHVHAPLARLCKLHIELDRNESAHEEGYDVALFEGLNSIHSSKTQLLLGVPSDNPEWSTMLRKLV